MLFCETVAVQIQMDDDFDSLVVTLDLRVPWAMEFVGITNNQVLNKEAWRA
jgi:hypothetical protein